MGNVALAIKFFKHTGYQMFKKILVFVTFLENIFLTQIFSTQKIFTEKFFLTLKFVCSRNYQPTFFIHSIKKRIGNPQEKSIKCINERSFETFALFVHNGKARPWSEREITVSWQGKHTRTNPRAGRPSTTDRIFRMNEMRKCFRRNHWQGPIFFMPLLSWLFPALRLAKLEMTGMVGFGPSSLCAHILRATSGRKTCRRVNDIFCRRSKEFERKRDHFSKQDRKWGDDRSMEDGRKTMHDR